MPIGEAIRAFAKHGVEAAYIVPTETGLEKGIIDAHHSLRDYLKAAGIHDYASQRQGEDGKRIVRGWFASASGLVETKVSMYRPETKMGDPRIWPYGLKQHCRAWNLIAVINVSGDLYFLNMSDRAALASIDDPTSPIRRALGSAVAAIERSVEKLLEMMREIGKMGFVDSLRPGDTGIGFTLETLLGIEANSSTAPDFEGIEIKASRMKKSGRQGNRVNLFSQVPNWKISSLSNGLEILDRHGYRDTGGRLQLYCTVSSDPNPQGLFLTLNESEGLLENLCCRPIPNEPVVAWELDKLRARLVEKHSQTFWVKAKTQKNSAGIEQFHYIEVEHTQAPLVGNFEPLVEMGAITMDYVLHEEKGPSGGRKARDHGYLFKIHPENFDLLFPPSKIYALA